MKKSECIITTRYLPTHSSFMKTEFVIMSIKNAHKMHTKSTNTYSSFMKTEFIIMSIQNAHTTAVPIYRAPVNLIDGSPTMLGEIS